MSIPVFLIIQRHVTGPVTLYPLVEVLHGFFDVSVHIIWAPKFHLLQNIFWRYYQNTITTCEQLNHLSWTTAGYLDVLCNNLWILTNGFNKENLGENKHRKIRFYSSS